MKRDRVTVALAIVGGFAAVDVLHIPSPARHILIPIVTATSVGVLTRRLSSTIGWTAGCVLAVLLMSRIQESYALFVLGPPLGGLVAGLIIPSQRRWLTVLVTPAATLIGAAVGVVGLEAIGQLGGTIAGMWGGISGAALGGALSGAIAGELSDFGVLRYSTGRSRLSAGGGINP